MKLAKKRADMPWFLLLGEFMSSSATWTTKYSTVTLIVLSKSDNGDRSPYELYVTDYTKNDQVIPMRSNFWPSSLAETVLKIKTWDAALPVGKTMEQGRIYRMKNVRMIVGRSGGLEAKICERKFSEPLDDGGRTDFDAHLRKFLERKREE
ncbi:hypothetical protein IW261DRAFT_1606145 [Armillaria novae-zelandiae]|uniref:Uncharacterized protein n=1 Tax=Armillaria novae-zelandiae TaxID=153914 RepID=A0AA39PF42_9AGAR|nr:hypothetical protein IW261DRAFT_1606145 [Armillaria novae-zelandiae]